MQVSACPESTGSAFDRPGRRKRNPAPAELGGLGSCPTSIKQPVRLALRPAARGTPPSFLTPAGGGRSGSTAMEAGHDEVARPDQPGLSQGAAIQRGNRRHPWVPDVGSGPFSADGQAPVGHYRPVRRYCRRTARALFTPRVTATPSSRSAPAPRQRNGGSPAAAVHPT